MICVFFPGDDSFVVLNFSYASCPASEYAFAEPFYIIWLHEPIEQQVGPVTAPPRSQKDTFTAYCPSLLPDMYSQPQSTTVLHNPAPHLPRPPINSLTHRSLNCTRSTLHPTSTLILDGLLPSSRFLRRCQTDLENLVEGYRSGCPIQDDPHHRQILQRFSRREFRGVHR